MNASRRLLLLAALLVALPTESAAFVHPAMPDAAAQGARPTPVPTTTEALGDPYAQPALGTFSAIPLFTVATSNEGLTGRTARATRRHTRANPHFRFAFGRWSRTVRARHRRTSLAWAPRDRVDRTGRPFLGALAPPAPIRIRT